MSELDPIEISRWIGGVDQHLHTIDTRLDTMEDDIRDLPDRIETRVERIFNGTKADAPPEGVPKGVVTFRWIIEKFGLPVILAVNTGAIALLFKLLYDHFF